MTLAPAQPGYELSLSTVTVEPVADRMSPPPTVLTSSELKIVTGHLLAARRLVA